MTEDYTRCESCGAAYFDWENFPCANCGAKFINCPHCQEHIQINDGDNCVHCGYKIYFEYMTNES